MASKIFKPQVSITEIDLYKQSVSNIGSAFAVRYKCTFCNTKLLFHQLNDHNSIHILRNEAYTLLNAKGESIDMTSMFNKKKPKRTNTIPTTKKLRTEESAIAFIYKTFSPKVSKEGDLVSDLKKFGWNIDVSEGINADGQKGIIISLVKTQQKETV